MRWPLVANRINTPKATKSGARFSITNYCNHSFGSLTKLTYLLWSKKTNKNKTKQNVSSFPVSLFPWFFFFYIWFIASLKARFCYSMCCPKCQTCFKVEKIGLGTQVLYSFVPILFFSISLFSFQSLTLNAPLFICISLGKNATWLRVVVILYLTWHKQTHKQTRLIQTLGVIPFSSSYPRGGKENKVYGNTHTHNHKFKITIPSPKILSES